MTTQWAASTSPELTQVVQRVLINEVALEQRIQALGEQISKDYAGKLPVLVGVLKGVIPFMADLLRTLSIPVEVDFLAISRYRPGQKGQVKVLKDLDICIEGRHVLFVEDIVDTGLTLQYLLKLLRGRQPASLEVCTLLNKTSRRLVDLPLKYVGFEVPDFYLIGYGLDYRERYRNLPMVGIMRAEMLEVIIPGTFES